MLFHCPHKNFNLHLQLRLRTPDAWLVFADLNAQPERGSGAKIRAAGSVTGLEVFAVKADREGSRCIQRSCTHRDIMTIHHRSRRLHLLNESTSTRVAPMGHRLWNILGIWTSVDQLTVPQIKLPGARDLLPRWMTWWNKMSACLF